MKQSPPKLLTSLLGKAETDFERGLRRFRYTLLGVATILIIVVFAVNTYYHRGVIDSLLFVLSLGIGITPVLLPAVVSVGLSYSARFMANKGEACSKINFSVKIKYAKSKNRDLYE